LGRPGGVTGVGSGAGVGVAGVGVVPGAGVIGVGVVPGVGVTGVGPTGVGVGVWAQALHAKVPINVVAMSTAIIPSTRLFIVDILSLTKSYTYIGKRGILAFRMGV
jgi:hypothetical protein